MRFTIQSNQVISNLMSDPRKKLPWLVRMHYRMRTASFGMVFGATVLNIQGKGYSWYRWSYLIGLLMIYPHLQYLRSRFVKDPYKTEMRNLMVDSLLLGGFIVVVKFSNWLAFSVIMGTLSNNAANKGWRGIASAVLALGFGVVVALLTTGFDFSPETSLPAKIFCMVGLGGYLLTMNNIGFSRNNELRIVREKLRTEERASAKANMTKTRFLAAASHDLRQPIYTQGLVLSILESTDLTPKQQELVTHIRATTTASREMMDTLLDFSRIEAGAVNPVYCAFPIQPVLEKIVSEFSKQASLKGLHCRVFTSRMVVYSDPMLIELILRNLVSNAIRYTIRGGVLLACRQRGSTAVLEVRDTGIGINATQHSEIFREFHQLGNHERDRDKGLGLGLSIVSGLTQTLGHSLTLNSALNKGSVFKITLPLGESSAVLPPPKSSLPNYDPSEMHILLIDDDAVIRQSTREQICQWGFNCNTVATLEEAFAVAKATSIQLIISDYHLGQDYKGIQAITTLRSLINTSLPAILLTGDTSPDRVLETDAAGITLLHKPLNPDKLHNAIVSLLN